MTHQVEQVRYWVAVLVVITMPGALGHWLLVHPLAAFWRRLGPRRALTILFACIGLSAVGLFLVRDWLLGADLGPPRPAQVALGGALLLAAIVSQLFVSRHLTRSILVGVPELSAQAPRTLLIRGPYAYTRNPRYLVILVAMVGYALLLDYVGVWLITLVTFPGLYLIIRLEEKELESRFGAEYTAYCQKVPRLLPRRPQFQR